MKRVQYKVICYTRILIRFIKPEVQMDKQRQTELAEIARKIRVGIVEAVHSASSGHPGGSLSIADIVTYV